MRKIELYLSLQLLFFSFFALEGDVDWHTVTEDLYFHPEHYDLQVVEGGASHVNYHLVIDKEHYFIRSAEKSIGCVQDNLEIEYSVLKQLSALHISPKPIYLNAARKIMVTEYLHPDEDQTDLSDPLVRQQVMGLLHQIEKANIHIPRFYDACQEIYSLVSQVASLEDPLPSEFYREALPALEKIVPLLANDLPYTLCHLDLHSKNILKSNGQLWLIDWEYAAMGNQLLTLASMASIERWSDEEMERLLKDYLVHPREEDFYRLFLYRIIADIHWTAWNHIQGLISEIDMPYQLWENSFLEAALQRIRWLNLNQTTLIECEN